MTCTWLDAPPSTNPPEFVDPTGIGFTRDQIALALRHADQYPPDHMGVMAILGRYLLDAGYALSDVSDG